MQVGVVYLPWLRSLPAFTPVSNPGCHPLQRMGRRRLTTNRETSRARPRQRNNPGLGQASWKPGLSRQSLTPATRPELGLVIKMIAVVYWSTLNKKFIIYRIWLDNLVLLFFHCFLLIEFMHSHSRFCRPGSSKLSFPRLMFRYLAENRLTRQRPCPILSQRAAIYRRSPRQ